MALFKYNSYSTKGYQEQYADHIQNQYYVNDITRSVKNMSDLNVVVSRQNTQELKSVIDNASNEQMDMIAGMSQAVCQTLDFGFDKMGYKLNGVNNNLENISRE